MLNDYLSHMTEIAKQYEATVDKFMGMPFSYFGDPNSQGVEQDAKACVEMAIAMRQQMKLLRERWKKWVTQHCISEWALVLVIAT